MGFHARIDIGEGADGAGNGADGDLGPRGLQPAPRALELDIVAGQFQAEGGGLGVDAVAASDRGREPVLEGALLQRRQHQIDVLDQEVGGAGKLHGQRGVVDVR